MIKEVIPKQPCIRIPVGYIEVAPTEKAVANDRRNISSDAVITYRRLHPFKKAVAKGKAWNQNLKLAAVELAVGERKR